MDFVGECAVSWAVAAVLTVDGLCPSHLLCSADHVHRGVTLRDMLRHRPQDSL